MKNLNPSKKAKFPEIREVLFPYARKFYENMELSTILKEAEQASKVRAYFLRIVRGETICDVEAECISYVECMLRWKNERQPKVVLIDREICHPKLKYRGKCDLIAELDYKAVLVHVGLSPYQVLSSLQLAAAHRILSKEFGLEKAIVLHFVHSLKGIELVQASFEKPDLAKLFRKFKSMLEGYQFFEETPHARVHGRLC